MTAQVSASTVALESGLIAATELTRPRSRGECVSGPRPCPWASCRHHLAAELIRSERVGLDDELPDDAPTCSLDLADSGEATLDETAAHLGGLHRETARHVEQKALATFVRRAVLAGIIERPRWGTRPSHSAARDSEAPELAAPDGQEEDDEATVLTKWGRNDPRITSVIDATDAEACALVERIYTRAVEAHPTPAEEPPMPEPAPAATASPEPRSFVNVAALARVLLSRSPFRSPKTWGSAVVVTVDGTTNRVTSRGDLAADFRANDLPALAHEALARRVPPGCVLVFMSLENPEDAARFVVLDLKTGQVRR